MLLPICCIVHIGTKISIPCMKIDSVMMWNDTHFPAAMRSLNASTRHKAIELANQFMAQGNMTRQEAIAVSIAEARRLARQSARINEPTVAYAAPR